MKVNNKITIELVNGSLEFGFKGVGPVPSTPHNPEVLGREPNFRRFQHYAEILGSMEG